jgi:hypothetical protein
LAKKAASRRPSKPEQQSLFAVGPKKGNGAEAPKKSKAAHAHKGGKAKPAPADAKKVREAKPAKLVEGV